MKKIMGFIIDVLLTLKAKVNPYLIRSKPRHKQIYVIHGYGASIEDHWFQYVKKNLQNKNTTVTLIHLPNSDQPDFMKWQGALSRQISSIDNNTLFIAHSLGCLTVLNFLEHNKIKSVGGLVCVSGFIDCLPSLPELDEYIGHSKKCFLVVNNIGIKHMYISDNDSYVPSEFSINLAKQLGFTYTIIPNSGHFLAKDGYCEFPELVSLIKQILSINIYK